METTGIGIVDSLKSFYDLIRDRDFEKAEKAFQTLVACAQGLEEIVGEYSVDPKNICARTIGAACSKQQHLGDRRQIDILSATNKSYEQVITYLRTELFRAKFELLMVKHKDYSDVAFGYCDKEGNMIYTPAVVKIVGNAGKEKVVDFKQLRRIYESSKHGEKIKNYEIRPGVFLYTYPLFHDRFPVGVGFLLYNPEVKKESGRIFRFVREVLGEVKKMSDDYRITMRDKFS
ncbi:MAG: hypothetical protein AABX54_01555 [Nanoarchaeota archaeon]